MLETTGKPIGLGMVWGVIALLLSSGAWAGSLDSQNRIDRHAVLFQQAPAELQDRYRVDEPPYRLLDLPDAPVLGSCAFPGAQIEQVQYPRQGPSWARGDTVDLWVRDPSLGEAFQSATIAWHQPPFYGLTLANGKTLRWSESATWAQLLMPPAQYPGLEVIGRASDTLIVRCAIPGPVWQAQYHAVQQGDQMQLALDAVIQVPADQSWGNTRLTLSTAIGQASAPRVMMRLESAMADAAPGEIQEGVWRYTFAQPQLLQGNTAHRIWQRQVQIQRVHRLAGYLSARQGDQQSLSARRQWQLQNTEESGLGLAIPAGGLRIDRREGVLLMPAGQASLPALAPGASHWIDLGQSLAVSGQLQRIGIVTTEQRINSSWRLRLSNQDSETALIQWQAQLPAKAVLSGWPGQIELAPGQQAEFTLRLSEPNR